MRPFVGFAMEEGGDYDNDHSVGLPTTSTGRGALKIPTQASYPSWDQGGRSPLAEDPGEANESTGCGGLSRWDPGQPASRGQEGSLAESSAAALDTAL